MKFQVCWSNKNSLISWAIFESTWSILFENSKNWMTAFEVFSKKLNRIKITQKSDLNLKVVELRTSSQSIILGVVPTRNKLIGPLCCFAVKNSMITWTKKNGQMELQINCFVWNKIEFILWSLHYVQNCQYLSKTCGILPF